MRYSRDIQAGWMEYRATPMSGLGKSPAELLFNRNIRTKMPCSRESLHKKEDNEVKEKMKESKIKQKIYYDEKNGAKNLPKLKVGDQAMIKVKPTDKKWKRAKITGKSGKRSYEAEVENGSRYVRNRRFLRKLEK